MHVQRTSPFCRRSIVAWFTRAAVVVAAVAVAGAQADDKAARTAALKQSIAANMASLKSYTWVESTTISLKGEVKKQEQKQCFYGADGKVQKTPLPGAAPAPAKAAPSDSGRGGRLKKKVVENKVDEMKDYMEKVAALVKEYVPPDAARIQGAEGRSKAQGQGGQTVLTFTDYFKPGDALAIGFDPATKKIRSYRADSYVEKPKDDVVVLNVTFASLEDGTNYAQNVVLDVQSKKIEVKITNSGYRKSGG